MAGDSDLSTTSVFFDFDGTISTTDIGVHVLERLAEPRWRDFETDYDAGRIGSRECIAAQWECIPAHVTEADRRAVAAEVPLDPGFGPLLSWLRAAGAEVTVVSDGYGFYIDDALAEWEVPVVTNSVDFAANAVQFPNADAACEGCGACGTCKPRVIRAAAARGRRTIFVGDGVSDRYAARVADLVFAKAALADWCRVEGVVHQRFDDMAGLAAALGAEVPPHGA